MCVGGEREGLSGKGVKYEELLLFACVLRTKYCGYVCYVGATYAAGREGERPKIMTVHSLWCVCMYIVRVCEHVCVCVHVSMCV